MNRDDRLLPETRWAALVIFIILVPAVIILWGTPGDTAERWAWTIKPDLTPIFLGSGYGAGAYFFFRTFRAARWHPSSAGVLGACVFATLMLIATLIHWDRFNHGDAPFLAALAFWGWTIVYIITPLPLLVLWWRNRAIDPGEPHAGEPVLAGGVLLAARVFAAGAFIAGGVLFLLPSVAIDVWPWQLTPLTSRVLGSFTVQVGVGALVLSADRRWGTWRLIIQTFFVATGLLLLGAARAWEAFDEDNVMTYAYVAGLAGFAAALLVLYVRTERR